jgi:hypothetical protein
LDAGGQATLTSYVDYLFQRIYECGMLELACDAQRVAQVELADPQHIDPGRGCNFFQMVQPFLAFNLADDSGVFIGVWYELLGVNALEIAMIPNAPASRLREMK